MSISELVKEIKQLQTMVSSLGVAVAENCDMTKMAPLVQAFSGDDVTSVEKWIADVENGFLALELNDKQKLLAASRLLTGTAAVFLRTIRVTKYEDLKGALLKEFGSATALEKVHEQLRKRRIGPNESVHRYVLEMVEMGMNCTASEQELVDHIIEGLNDPSQAVAMLYRSRTVDELKTMLGEYERKRASRPGTNDSSLVVRGRYN